MVIRLKLAEAAMSASADSWCVTWRTNIL